MNMKIKDFNWCLITIDDPDFLSGKSIFNVVQLILKYMKINYVIINDVDGSGKDWLISNLQKNQNSILKIDDFLNILCEVNQFDWGDFFLFKEYPKDCSFSQEKSYSYVIAQTDVTIRAVDNQYIYIYTPYEEIIEAVKNKYTIESLRLDSLENLDYPY